MILMKNSNLHNRFYLRVNKSHSNIWHFISSLKKEKIVFQQQILQATSGARKSTTKKVSVMQDRLDTPVTRFKDVVIDIHEYLQGLSLLIANNVKSKKLAILFSLSLTHTSVVKLQFFKIQTITLFNPLHCRHLYLSTFCFWQMLFGI